MNQPRCKPGYSLHWARTIVSAFNDTFPRATDSAKQVYSFSDDQVAMWVANDQQRWRRYKEIIKQVARWDTYQQALGIPYESLNRCVVDAVEKLKKRWEWQE